MDELNNNNREYNRSHEYTHKSEYDHNHNNNHGYDHNDQYNQNQPEVRFSFFELLYGILLQPRLTFKKIAQTTPLKHAFVIFIGVNLLTTLVGVFTISEPQLPNTLGQGIPPEFQSVVDFFSSSAFTTVGTVFGLLFSLLMWLFLAAILSLSAEIFGGKGNAIGVLTVLGCATLPQIIAIPIEVFLYLIGLPSGLLALVSIPLLIWTQIILPILGIREVHKFSTGRALLSVLTPLLLIIGVITTLFITIITLMATFLG